jgi:hypothetical protein
VAWPRVLRKARMLSRLESTSQSYEFFNTDVELCLGLAA